MLRSEARRGARKPPDRELATITEALGLMLDSFSWEIPDGDYLIDETFGGRTENEAGGGGDGMFESHSHVIRRPLEAGDRVLVVMVGDGDSQIPYVIGRLP